MGYWQSLTGRLFKQRAAANAMPLEPAAARPRFKTLFAVGLLAVLAVVAVMQYPRIGAPYIWPDAASSPAVLEADLEAVVGAIEAYRSSQGRYPSILSQVRFPDGLAQLVSGAQLAYRPSDKGYALEWELPHWRASYSSETAKIRVEPLPKP